MQRGRPPTPNGQPRAKVFISCGQTRDSDEIEIAHRISERLSQLGYDPYIAGEEQTLRGVKENIFGQLETSEYLIFVDFRREKLVTEGEPVWRGSLFSHQELALASYFDIPVLAFQERGVKREDGLMRFLQANSTQFSDRSTLPNVIADMIQQKQWDPHWKNQLVLERDAGQFVDARHFQTNAVSRYFHVSVRNLHPRKPALNCYVYLERARNLSRDHDIRVETIELKWAGYTLPNAVIGPKSSRRFDAFWVPHDHPTSLGFNVFSDSTEFIPRIDSLGDHELTYLVTSENFPPAHGTFALHVGTRLEEIQFRTRE